MAGKQLQYIKNLQWGTSSCVFLANFLPEKKLVAVKVVSLDSEDNIAKHKTECAIAQQLSGCRNIITTLACYVESARGYMVMEVMKCDLLDVIPTLQDENIIRKLFQQICHGVADCHQHQIAHLDIKPENVLLDNDYNVFLCDFGAAAPFEQPLQSTVGTMYYQAPETRDSLHYNKPCADIWSLGVLLFVMLTNSFPYAGKTEAHVLLSLQKCEISFDLLDITSCSTLLKNIVKSTLQVDPSLRPTITQILNMLNM